MVYEPRTYRHAVAPPDLIAFEVVVAETDLQILAACDLRVEATALVHAVRGDIESYVAAHPRFAESFVPVPVEDDAPALIREMAAAGEAAGVGPMAAVAGCVAEAVARGLSVFSDEVIVENGGDVYLMGARPRTVALWAGTHGASGLGLELPAALLPCAMVTSSGTIGHSTSLGSADAVAVIAASGAVADAWATAIGNRIHGPDDLDAAMAFSRHAPGLLGVVATAGGAVAAWGSATLVPIAAQLG